MCGKKDTIEPVNLAQRYGATLSTGVGAHSLHLFMITVDKEGKIDAEISMHLPLEEVEELIKRLKHKLVLCYEKRVKQI